MERFRDYYKELGLNRDASESEIKTAFRNIMRQYHPDVNPGKEAQEKAKRASDAYDVLSDSAKKASYDRAYDSVKRQEQQASEKRRQEEEARRKAEEEKYRKAAEKKAAKMKREQERQERKSRRTNRWTQKNGGNNMNNNENGFVLGIPSEGSRSTSPIKSKIKVIVIGSLIVIFMGTTILTAYFLGKRDSLNNQKGSEDGRPKTEDANPKDAEDNDQKAKDEKGNILAGITEGDKKGDSSSETPKDEDKKGTTFEVGDKKVTVDEKGEVTIKDKGDTPKENSQTAADSKPIDENNPSMIVVDETEQKINAAASAVQANWKSHGVDIDIDTIKEVVKVANEMESSLTVEDLDSIVTDVVSNAVNPAINNAMAGVKEASPTVSLSSLFIKGQTGLGTLRAMELNFNGALKDPNNLGIYCERAFTDQALLLINGETLDGFNANHTTAPAVRIVWARLAGAMTGLAGTLGDDLTVTVNGTTFTQNELNNSSLFRDVVSKAKGDLGISSRQMNY